MSVTLAVVVSADGVPVVKGANVPVNVTEPFVAPRQVAVPFVWSRTLLI